MKKKIIDSQKGITLVEIIIAVAISSIIILAMIQMSMFGTQMFARGDKASFNIMNIRNAIRVTIGNEMRYVKELEGVSAPSNSVDGYKYIYFDYTDKTLVFKDCSKSPIEKRNLLDSTIQPSIDKNHFIINDKSVVFKITDESGKYTLDTTVNLLNWEAHPPVSPDPNVKHIGVRFK